MNLENEQKPAGTTPTRRALTVAGVAALVVPRHVLGGPGNKAPSDRLNIAGVGVGGMGRRYLQGCSSERIVALCDVDHSFAAPVFRTYPDARVYRDFRQMFDHEEKNIDAVIVATPDHNHAIITMRALRLGKHVYCAKPMTHTIFEARHVVAAAREAKVATQMSVQSCASDAALSTAEVLACGVIGPVREVHVWTDHPIYPAAGTRPADIPAEPYGLDWDLWIGTAPTAPIIPRITHGSGVRGGTSVRAPSAIWLVMPCTYFTMCSNSPLPRACMPAAPPCTAVTSKCIRMGPRLFHYVSKRRRPRAIQR